MNIKNIALSVKRILLTEIIISPYRIVSALLIISITSSLYSCGIYRSAAEKRTQNGYYKVGDPYVINGKKYYPKVEANYDEIGTASWYGPTFHGNKTANGATFNSGSMTAAHRTLPLPSIVRVTNLENNRSTFVVINDRGPFAKDRIIDVSKKVADALGFKHRGTARVRVQFLPDRTEKLLAELGYNNKVVATNMAKPTKIPNIIKNQNTKVIEKTDNKELADNSDENSPTPVYIKAGTFGIKSNAQKVENDLKPLANTKISNVNLNGKNLYQVWLGPWLDKNDANNILQKVTKLGHNDALLVSNQ